MVNVRQVKSQYSEEEAAAELGISIEELRSLIRRHVVTSDEEMSHSSLAAFSASDILVLRILGREGAVDPAASKGSCGLDWPPQVVH